LTHLRVLNKLSVFLIVLLLSNSSLALEVLTHDSHQHTDPQMSQHEMHSGHDMSDAQSPASKVSNMGHGAEDCVCDDICCVSSVDFGLTVSDNHPPFVGSDLIPNSNFYSSVSLDLFVPPPNR
jgi:hypothetical protein